MANTVITIARQYGAAGRQTGEILAEMTGMPCYDRELITLAASKSGMNEDVVAEIDEKASSSLLYTLALGSVDYTTPSIPAAYNIPINDKLFIAQCSVIKELAAKSPCIIVGRCADYVLRDNPKCINVYLQADLTVRAKRVAARQGISVSDAQDVVMKTDKRRASYYGHYTGQKWGRSDLYDLVIDTTVIGAQGAAEVIAKFLYMFKQIAKDD